MLWQQRCLSPVYIVGTSWSISLNNTSFIALLSAFTISNVLVEGKSLWSSMSSTMTNTFFVNLLSILRCSDSHREHCKTTRMLWPFDKFSRSNVFSKINFSLLKATKESPKKQKYQQDFYYKGHSLCKQCLHNLQFMKKDPPHQTFPSQQELTSAVSL